MFRVFENIKKKRILIKELIKHKRFLDECKKESDKIRESKDFKSELENIFSQSISVIGPNFRFFPVCWILNNNYNNLYNGILELRRHSIDLFAWINVYENESNEKEKDSMLYGEVEDSLTLICDSIYSFKEKIIYAVVTTAWEYQNLLNEPVDWKFDERNIKFKVLNEKFDHIDEIKKLIVKISKIQKDLGERPLYFRHKHTHRIQPGLEKYGGQAYSIQISKKSRRFGFGRGESIKLEEIKPKIRESYCDCIDLFYEFENYCVDYLEVKKWIKTT